MTRTTHPVSVVALLALTGCFVPSGGDLDIGAVSQAVSSSNKLSLNKLSLNKLSLNKLSLNKLALNKLALTSLAGPGFALDPVATSGMELDEDGREVLDYLVRCALPEGESLVFVSQGVRYEFSGLMGLAPRWKTRPPTPSERRAVSACLLAHGNLFGVSVPISARMGTELPVSDDERARFAQYEASFFGDVFGEKQEMYACLGSRPPDFSVSYPEHDTLRGDRLLRRCADPDPDRPGMTMCGLAYLGSCQRICSQITENGSQGCSDGNNEVTTVYREVMSTWLLAHDDPSSAWPDLYDEVYGP